MNSPVDMSRFIAPKSDQINADSLIGGPKTITITRVSANEGSPDQPINVFFAEDQLPFRPCKSMRRVMVHIWGSDASRYVGKSMILYRDPGVQFGGMQVGGIRISHMSDIPEDKLSKGVVQMSLTATRAKRAPYVVKELKVEPRKDDQAAWANTFITQVKSAQSAGDLETLITKQNKWIVILQESRPELYAEIEHVIAVARDGLKEGRTDEQHGDQFDGADFGEED
jgi:hypothetical protein